MPYAKLMILTVCLDTYAKLIAEIADARNNGARFAVTSDGRCPVLLCCGALPRSVASAVMQANAVETGSALDAR